ncbi:MAG: hypothetical protein C3F17_03415 [Bradyrhizobiaceae bacterium]|nr:MAG: hypothetical protein C3F17_03415 [Bradyrhizobiaceae bacterium]
MNAPVVIAQAGPPGPGEAPRTIRMSKPQGGAAVVLQLDGAARLDPSAIAAEQITLVRVGERLVILFDNQATVTLAPFFGADGAPVPGLSLQLGAGQAVDAARFADLFPISDDQSILPAAGEGARNTGGQFGTFSIDSLIGGGDGLDLLGGETGAGARFGAAPLANDQPTARDLALGLDEDAIALGEGNLDGPGDDLAPAVATGTLPVSFGSDGVGDLAFEVASGPVAGLTSGGDPVSYALSADGRTLTASTQNGVVFTIALAINADSSVSCTVTLLQPLDHPSRDDPATPESERAFEDNLRLAFPFTIRDANGDSASATLTLDVDDDTPVIALAESRTVDEDGLGNAGDSYPQGDAPGAALSVTGSLGISWGADRFNDSADGGVAGGPVAGDRAVVFSGLGDGVLSSVQAATLLAVAGADGPLDLADLACAGEALVFTLSGSGTVLTATTVSGGPVFTVSLSDTGDAGSYTFVLQGPLDHPRADAEDDLILTFGFTAYDSDGDAASGAFTVTVDDDAPVSTGRVQSAAVYENELPAGTAFGSSTDLNGDGGGNDTRYTGNLKSLVSFGADKAGTYIVETVDLAPELLALTSGGVPLTYAIGVDNMLIATANGVAIFDFQVDPDTGQYSFRLKGPLDHLGGDAAAIILDMSSAVTARDSDGDTVALAGQIHVTILDDSPAAPDAAAPNPLSEDGPNPILSNAALGMNWGADDGNDGEGQPGDRALVFSTAALALGGSGAISSLTSNGLPVTLGHLDAAHTILVAYTGASAPTLGTESSIVFLASLSDIGTGSYSFDLRQPLDHPAPDGAQQHYIDLTFSYTATDADGDVDAGGFTVRIDAAGTVSSIDYSGLATGVFVNLANVATTVAGETVAANSATDRASVTRKVVGIDQLGAITTAYGSQGDDILVGGNEASRLDGNDGDDLIYGLGGNDDLRGGVGDDVIDGGAGHDLIRGGAGDDTLTGGDGSDTFFVDGAGQGHDTYWGGPGDDRIKAESDGTIVGLQGDFGAANSIGTIEANGFADVRVWGDADGNLLDFSGTALADVVVDGREGDDEIFASNSTHTVMRGGAGDDILHGSALTNTVYLVDGADEGVDTYLGGAKTDTIKAESDGTIVRLQGDFGAVNSIESIEANGFSDVKVWGEDTGNVLDFSQTALVGVIVDGRGGADEIFASTTSHSILRGGAGDDVLHGSDTSNTIYLVNGTDEGEDTYRGGTRTDQIKAESDGTIIRLKGDFGAANRIDAIEANGFADVRLWGDAGGNNLDFSATSLVGVSVDGRDGDDVIRGSAGADRLFGGAGDDLIIHHAGDGADRVDGGSETGTAAPDYDTLRVIGDSRSRTFTIGKLAQWTGNNIVPADGNPDLADLTVQYTGPGAAMLRADEVEHVDVVAGTGAVTLVVGDLSDTAILPATVGFEGGDGADTVDLTGRTSPHRIVADGGADTDTVVFGFASTEASLEEIVEDGSLVGIRITRLVAGASVTDEFRNFETLRFTDGSFTPAELLNDAPVLTPVDVAGEVTEDVDATGGSLTESGSVTFADPDVWNTVTASAGFVDAVADGGAALSPGLLAALQSGAFQIAVSGSDNAGTIDWSFAVDNGLVQYLRAGQSVTATYRIAVSDGHGGVDAEDVTVTIHGADDNALIGDPTVASVTEDLAPVNGLLAVSGVIPISDPDGDVVVFVSASPAEGNLGNLNLAPDGSYTYRVANSAVQHLGVGESKVDTFTVTASDGTTRDVAFTIHGVNDPARNAWLDGDTVDENAPVGTLVGVLRAFDAEGDPVTWFINGTANGRFTIDRLTGEVRTAVVLDYEALAGQSYIIAATPLDVHGAGDMLREFTIRVNDVNEAPTSAYTIVEQQYVSGPNTASLLENTHTAAPIRLTWVGYLDDALGSETLTLGGTDAALFELQGSFVFLRAGVQLDYETRSSYQVTIDIDDASVGSTPDTSVTFNLTVANLTIEPVAGSDSFTIGEDGSLAVTGPGILGNDTIPNGLPLTVNTSTLSGLTLVEAPTGLTIADLGTLSVSADGSFNYAPGGDFDQLRAGEQAVLAFTYRAANGVANSNLASVTITVTGENDAAVISEITPGVALVEGFEGSIQGTWTQVGWSAIDPARATEGARAILVSSEDDDTWIGAEPAELEQALGLASGALGQALGDVVDGGAIAITLTNLTAGTYTLSFDWFYRAGDYLPYNDSAFVAIDGTVHRLADVAMVGDEGSSGWQTFTLTVTVGATLALGFGAVNAIDVGFNGTLDVDLVRLSATDLVEDRVLSVGGSVSVSDVDRGEAAIQAASGASQKGYGSYAVDAAGHWTFTLDNAHPDVQALAVGETATDSFILRSLDGTEKEITVTIRGVNDAPVVADPIADRASPEDTAVSFTLPAGAFADDTAGTLALSAQLANGDPLPSWLGFDPATGLFSGTPPANFAGDLEIRVTATDGSALSVFDDFRLTIVPVNDAPVVRNDGYTTAEDQALVVAGPGVLANDSDVDGDALTAVLVAGPSHGTLTLDPDGAFSYVPHADYHGTDSFQYRANDGALNSAGVATVAIVVTPANDAPVAVDDAFTTRVGTPLAGNLLFNTGGNDYDVDGDALRLAVVDPTGGDPADAVAVTVTGQDWQTIALTNGTLQVQADGDFAYTPDAGYLGAETFAYAISDGQLSAIAAVTVNVVENQNRAPVLNGEFGPLYAHSSDFRDAAGLSVLIPEGLVTDPDGDPLTWSVRTLSVTSALAGNADDDGDGIGGWWSFDAATRTFTGTYPSTTSSRYDQAVIEITARDADGAEVSFLTTISGILGNSYTFPEAFGFSAGTFKLMYGSSHPQNGFTSSTGGLVLAGGGSDTFGGWAGHVANDAIYGEDGDDLLLGEEGDDFLHGGAGNDGLSGGEGRDFLLGGADDDRLYGGLGDDRLTGGSGADTFRFESAAQGTDAMVDFDAGEGDVIELLASAFGLAPGTDVATVFRASPGTDFDHAAGEKLHFDTSTRTLWYDGDGAGGIAALALARLENGVDLQAGDIRLA